MLLGETGLEETFEHLTLDGLHLAAYGTHILDPGSELEQFLLCCRGDCYGMAQTHWEMEMPSDQGPLRRTEYGGQKAVGSNSSMAVLQSQVEKSQCRME